MSNETALAAAAAGPGLSDPGNKTVSQALTAEPSAARRIMADAIRASLTATEPAQEAAAGEGAAEETPQLETPEATPAEAESTPEPGEAPAEGEADQPAEEPGDEHRDKQWPESARKRVDKLTAKRKEAEAALEAERKRVQDLESKIAALEVKQPDQEPRAPAQPELLPSSLTEVNTLDQLQHFTATTRGLVRNIERYREELMEDGERADFEKYLTGIGLFNPETGEVRKRELSQLAFDIRQTVELIPERRKVLEESARIEPHIVELYPYWKDRTHPDYARAQEVLRMMPQIRSRPNWKHLVSLFLRGVDDEARLIKENGKPKTPGNGAPKPPPKVPGTPAAAVAPASGAAVSRDLRDKAISGSREDRVAWVRSQLPKTVTTG